MRYVCSFCWYCKCRIVYHHYLDFLFIIIVNLIIIIFFSLFLDEKPRYMTFYIPVQWNGMAKSIMGSQTPSHREWLLIGANSAIFRSWIFIVLAHWNNSLWIDISPHSVTLSWFRANQSLIFLLNNVCMSEESSVQWFQMRYVCSFCWYCKCRIVYHHYLDFLFIIIVNLIIIIFFSLFLDVNEYRGDPWYGHLYRKRDLLLSSCDRAKCVLMTLSGEILDTVYCENNDVCSPLIHTRSCLSRNSLSACTIFKTFKRMLETILPVSFMKWILLSLSNIRIIPKLVQTIPPFLGCRYYEIRKMYILYFIFIYQMFDVIFVCCLTIRLEQLLSEHWHKRYIM
jgi:hypothetical protein